MRFSRRFYQRDPIILARDLLGRRLVRLDQGKRLAGDIVEVEAYLGVPDLAAHTSGGRRTPRNESMYRDGGHLYVYFTYGLHFCMNVVASEIDEPVAVLIRAIEPVEGLEVMRERRTRARKATDLCSGPAKLCQALGIDRQYDGLDLADPKSPIFIEPSRVARSEIESRTMTSPRIGVAYAGQWALRPLRFYLRDNPHVSKP
jgi:DNA-3-methyladenine glycosylase